MIEHRVVALQYAGVPPDMIRAEESSKFRGVLPFFDDDSAVEDKD